MYQYQWHTAYSTKPSSILDEEGKVIGTIRKKYSKPFKRILDLPFSGKLFVEYSINDKDGNLKFESSQVLDLFKRRQYHINYYEDNQHYHFLLIDKKMLDLGEDTTFEFDGVTYQLKQPLFQWAKVLLNDQVIAEWHIPFKPPFKVQFKLHDKTYEERVLFLIGIFHTYLHAL